jgi:site-specific DNA-cytosine methylase
MKAMQLPHDHVFSCDVDKQVQLFIRATCPPSSKLFTDMLNRHLPDIPEVDIYVCGFPCTPYSSLRQHHTKLLKEPAAKPLFEVLKVLRERRPPLAILENVPGLQRVQDKVLSYLTALKWYYVLWMPIDSTHFGEPVSRPRVYFLLLRRDACVSSDLQQMARFCEMCFDATHKLVRDHMKHRMLPNENTEVRALIGKIARRGPQRSDGKWFAKHDRYRQSPEFRNASPAGVPESRCLGLTSPRQIEVWEMLQRAKGKEIIADVSQNIDRAPCRTNGVCPTITPRGVICVGALGRPVLPCEKLLLHGFPLHKLRIPKVISEQTLAHLGGNTMHLQSIGFALLMGISLLRDPLPRAPPSACPEDMVKPIFVSAPRCKKRTAAALPATSKRLRVV